ncbi:MAG: GGDEF domain-containing protein [Edaphobacter sp.]|uniref:GGDEF domain-containing protein n=1 Tax=Edaphobacter sp. TaxID=1934404 RepID=UPI00238D6611|nr:GGDEF domain-containing protein [Edaphobacter sp.]MDE1175899.1 GGDEF domain-containing protein [Edaphobacter sp.]
MLALLVAALPSRLPYRLISRRTSSFMLTVARRFPGFAALLLSLIGTPLNAQQATSAEQHMHLDTATLLIVMMLSASIFGGLFLFHWMRRPTETVFPLWGFANLSCGCGCLLFGLFAMQGPNFITAIANGLAIAFFSLMWAGLRRFDGRAVIWTVVWLPPVLITLLFSLPISTVDNLTWHIYVYSLVSACFCVACFVECWMGQREEPLDMRRLAMTAFALAFVTTVLRVMHFAWTSRDNLDMEWLAPAFAVMFLGIFLVWSQAILLMLNERYANQLLNVARHDGLTGALNRAGFRELAQPEIERCRQSLEPVWLLLFDLDHFKKVNDTYGHEAGDLLLHAFVATARQTTRAEDLLSRYGGEEFCMLLPDCSKKEALSIAERLRQAFEVIRVTVAGQTVGTTVSIGAAEVGPGKDPLRAALRRADRALYAAKEQGRNRLVFADGRAEAGVVLSQ